jgi:hypothetical protein
MTQSRLSGLAQRLFARGREFQWLVQVLEKRLQRSWVRWSSSTIRIFATGRPTGTSSRSSILQEANSTAGVVFLRHIKGFTDYFSMERRPTIVRLHDDEGRGVASANSLNRRMSIPGRGRCSDSADDRTTTG